MKPTKHYKNRDFPPSDAAHPIFERMTGSILERIGPKKAPHYRAQQHIYIYIFIFYAVEMLSGPSLAFWGVNIWSKFAKKTLFVQKSTIN